MGITINSWTIESIRSKRKITSLGGMYQQTKTLRTLGVGVFMEIKFPAYDGTDQLGFKTEISDLYNQLSKQMKKLKRKQNCFSCLHQPISSRQVWHLVRKIKTSRKSFVLRHGFRDSSTTLEQIKQKDHWLQKNLSINRPWTKREQQRYKNDDKLKSDTEHLNLKENTECIYECQGKIQGHCPPLKSLLSEKLIFHAHLRTIHGGVNITMPNIRKITGYQD